MNKRQIIGMTPIPPAAKYFSLVRYGLLASARGKVRSSAERFSIRPSAGFSAERFLLA
jgi:hypothetical protein